MCRSISDSEQIIATARSDKRKSLSFILVTQEHINICLDSNIPQIYFNQLNIMAHQHHAARNNTASWLDPKNPPPVDNIAIFADMNRRRFKPCLMRAFLKKHNDWMDWALSGYKQLNQYHTQVMFKKLTKCPHKCNFLPLI